MVSEDLLSVVITAQNEEATIERAILSVANQSYAHIEIIIVNDGSTDSTPEIIKEITKRLNGVRMISNDYATGLMAARNLGVVNANGKFIAFLDGDDEWARRKAETQLPVLVELPGGAILFTARIIYSAKGNPFIFGKKSVSNELFVYNYNQVLSKNGIFHLGASMMLERSTFEMLGGFDEKAGKERDLIARVGVMGGTIAWLGTPLYIQHRKLGSMSTDIEQTYRRELDMLGCWEPGPERHPTRDITEQEYQAYRESITRKYNRQFFLSNIDTPGHDPACATTTFLQKLELYKYKIFKPLYNTANNCMAFIRYKIYKSTHTDQC